MKTLITRFAKDESGVTAIEYGLIAALIAVVIITAVTSVGTTLQGTFFRNPQPQGSRQEQQEWPSVPTEMVIKSRCLTFVFSCRIHLDLDLTFLIHTLSFPVDVVTHQRQGAVWTECTRIGHIGHRLNFELRIPMIATTHSDGSRPPVPIDRDQFGAGANGAIG